MASENLKELKPLISYSSIHIIAVSLRLRVKNINEPSKGNMSYPLISITHVLFTTQWIT